MEFKTDALVLRVADYGESDRMVTLLTADRGKIGAAMKGVRKAGAKLKFAAQPFCFAEYVFAEKGGRHTVISASVHDSFFQLAEDVVKYYAAAVVCEACDKLVFEGMASGELLVAAVSALTEMSRGADLAAQEITAAQERTAAQETFQAANAAKQGAEQGTVQEADGAFPLIKFLLTALRLAGYPVGAPALQEGERIFFDMERGAFSSERGTPASAVTLRTVRRAMGSEHCQPEREGEKRALRLLYSYFGYQTDIELAALSEYIKLL